MTQRRRWMRLDLDFYDQDTVQELADHHGAAGPATFLWVLLEAEKQAIGAAKPEQGTATFRASAPARKLHLEPSLILEVLASCRSLGLLAVDEGTDGRIVTRSLKRARWVAKDVNGAERQRKWRESQNAAACDK